MPAALDVGLFAPSQLLHLQFYFLVCTIRMTAPAIWNQWVVGWPVSATGAIKVCVFLLVSFQTLPLPARRYSVCAVLGDAIFFLVPGRPALARLAWEVLTFGLVGLSCQGQWPKIENCGGLGQKCNCSVSKVRPNHWRKVFHRIGWMGGTNHDMSARCFKIQLVWQGMVLMLAANDVSREHDAT